MPETIIIIILLLCWSSLFLFLLRIVSGWGRMLKKYRTTQAPPVQMSYMSGGQIGISGFRGTLNIGVSFQGLYLSTIFPFSLTLPPLMIPWSEVIKVKKQKYWFTHTYNLHINTRPVTILRLPPETLTAVKTILQEKESQSI